MLQSVIPEGRCVLDLVPSLPSWWQSLPFLFPPAQLKHRCSCDKQLGMSLLRACKSDNGRCNRCLSKSRTRNAKAKSWTAGIQYQAAPISTTSHVNPFLARPQHQAVKLWTSPLTTTSNSLLPPVQGVEVTVELATAPGWVEGLQDTTTPFTLSVHSL